MRNFSYSGQSLSFVATEPVTSGQPYMLGSVFGVVASTLGVGQSGELFLTGVWKLPKAAKDFVIGQKVYWDSTNKILTGGADIDGAPLPPHLKLVGISAEVSDATQTEFLLRLNGVSI